MRILINNQTKESTYYDPRKAVKKRYYYDNEEEEDIETPAPQPIQQENPAPNGRPRTERDNRFYEKLQVNDSDDEKTNNAQTENSGATREFATIYKNLGITDKRFQKIFEECVLSINEGRKELNIP